ncbi:MAG: indolepyruvate oxidoreductase subunit beta [Betaproteobacteria bacterium]|nr:indolepyruvate oxidoreductase subunit beta [Betaproteobacteria bacterium]
MMTVDVLVVGIGGQGVMTAAEAIARAALDAGFAASKTEVTGMSQRGGVVCSQLRIGERIGASEIRPGTAALLIAFEAAEGLRWGHYLTTEGWVLLDAWRAVPPIVSSGLHQYPTDPAAELRAANRHVQEVDARGVAARLGDVRLANSVMLGAAAARLPFPPAALRAQVLERFRAGPLAERNAAAFDAGCALTS